MKIANIVHKDDLVNHNKVDYIEYYGWSPNIWNIKNPELPTLYVGWNFINTVAIPNAKNDKLKEINILKHQIVKNKLYWEFSFDENKSAHITGVESFVKHAPDFYFTPNYKYTNLDPIFHQLKDNQDLFDVLPKNVAKSYWLYDRMLYILGGDGIYTDEIYGLDLDMYRFFKFDVDEIKRKLFEMSFNFVHDPQGTYFQKYSKIFTEFPLLKRYLVVLVSI